MRQGGHLPQDSLLVKDRKYLATSTMQSSSSRTTMPPEPMIEPTRRQGVEVHLHVEELGRDAAARGSAGLDRLELPCPGSACRRRCRR